VREADTAAVIRVMTVHKAKGLGFDLVILPDLEGTRLDSRREGLAVQRAADRSVDWVLDLPGKLFSAHDAVLAAQVHAAEDDACYENLSLLYVAMTRAKRAMYLITKPSGKSTSRNFPKLLAGTLGEERVTVRVGKLELAGAFAEGDAAWHTRVEPAPVEKPAAAELARLDPAAVSKSPRLQARRPSDQKTGVLDAAKMFTLGGDQSGADFGRAVHALLAEVQWLDDARRLAAQWAARDGALRLGSGQAVEVALACLRAPELASVWVRPPAAAVAEVWRERAFEIVLDGAWVTGVLDRVVIERDASGGAVRATVFDFKTDADDQATVERHTGQLNLYRQAVANLAAVAENAVACELVFTRFRRRVEVPVARR
jgi:ATP-dependent helicase/nuclease subunit A